MTIVCKQMRNWPLDCYWVDFDQFVALNFKMNCQNIFRNVRRRYLNNEIPEEDEEREAKRKQLYAAPLNLNQIHSKNLYQT